MFDEDALSVRMREVQTIVGSSVHLCYSIKANPFLIPAMLNLVELLEVCSPGELIICEDMQVKPERVLFSGVNKTERDVFHAVDFGVNRFTAESLMHVAILQKVAKARGRRLSVLLRLTAGTQFGMDEADLRQVISNRHTLDMLDVEGIHYFAGTQRKKLTDQRKELDRLEELMADLRTSYGFETRRLEYGPGLYYPYFVHEDSTDTLALLRELAPDLQRLAQQTELTIEMGRFFASECGTYLTQVMDTKINCGHAYAILDGGIHHVNYLGSNMGMRVPRISLYPGPQHNDEAHEWSLCGSLCTTADVLVRSIALPGLAPGDLLAFHAIGAYSVTEGPMLFLSRNLPRIVMVSDGKPRLVRSDLPSAKINQPNC